MIQRFLSFLACLTLASLACSAGIGSETAALWLDEAFRAEIPGVEAVYFPISGISEDEWRASSVLEVVAAGGPDNSLAWTTWGYSFHWECESGKIVGLQTEANLRVYLPRPMNLPLQLIPAWRDYFRMLVDHEAEHIKIVRDHIGDFDGINGTPCDKAMGRVNRIYAYIGQLNRQFDGLE